MRVRIDKSRCNGCGFCMDAYPELYRLGTRYSEYTGPDRIPESLEEAVRGSVMICPAIAISLVSDSQR